MRRGSSAPGMHLGSTIYFKPVDGIYEIYGTLIYDVVEVTDELIGFECRRIRSSNEILSSGWIFWHQSIVQLLVFDSFYPRDVMLARVFATATCLSVCLSGRPSVTRRYCA